MPPTSGHGSNAERGQVTVLVVLIMSVFLLAFFGFAVDYAGVLAQRRKVQTAADSVCQAAAMDLLLYAEQATTAKMNFTPVVNGTLDCSSHGTAAPCIIARMNGFDGKTSSRVLLNFPSQVNGQNGPSGVEVPFVSVNITADVPAYFSQLATSNPTVRIGASASCGLTAPASPAPITVLHPNASPALSVGGSSSITIIGGAQRGIQVNSNSATAVSVSSVDLSLAGPSSTGGDFAVWGGPSSQPGGINLGSTGSYIYPAIPTSDPFADMKAPDVPSTIGSQKAVAFKEDGCPDSGGCIEFSPGYYSTGITVKNNVGIFVPGLYYVVGGLSFGSNGTVRVSTANGDGSGGVVFYLRGNQSVSVEANFGKKPATCPYNVDGSTCPGGSASRAMQCPGGNPPPSQVPSSINGNVLLGPCTGPYADPSGKTRGMVFFQDRSAATLPTWGGGGQFLLAGYMYFHQCRADGGGKNCSYPGSGGFGTTFSMAGNACSGSYAVGALITDVINLNGTPCLKMVLSPDKNFPRLAVSLLK